VRIDEIASAAEQLALWKLVSDNVWMAIGLQAKQEAERQAAAKRIAKPKPKRRATSKPSKAPYAAPPKPLPKPTPLYPAPTQAAQQQPAYTAPVNSDENRSIDELDHLNALQYSSSVQPNT
jgi:hypothetical protein